MSWQHDDRSGDRTAVTGPEMLASDADRDAAASTLGTAFAEGRLTSREHEERVRAVYAARTWRDLERLTADLPAPGGRAAVAAAAGTPDVWPLDRCLLCVLLIACPPAGIIWMLLAWRRSRRDQSGQSGQSGPAGPDGTR